MMSQSRSGDQLCLRRLEPCSGKERGHGHGESPDGLGIDEFFTGTDGVGVRALLPDALSSPVALGDGTGTLQTQYTYEPFGVTTQTGAASTSSFKYTGREDDSTGLMYYRARYYQPRLQRFISEDPIEFLGGDVNLYGYVGKNPILSIDPLGLSSLEFDRGSKTLTLRDRNGFPVTSYPAGNDTINPGGDPNTKGCNRPAPNGTFPLQRPISTAGSLEYGSYFFPVGARGPKGERLDIARLRGIGVHAGRTGPRSRTRGCIRVSDDDVRDLCLWYQLLEQIDPITHITIN
jgi:RHS repeat-associated protein